jgi:hypothetical protein
MQKLWLVIVLTLLTACVAKTNYYAATLQTWQGAPVDDLVKTWGLPDQVVANANHTSNYIYTSKSEQKFPYPTSNQFVTVINKNGMAIGSAVPGLNTDPSVLTLHCTTIFNIDNHNMIIGTQHGGGNCFGDQNFRQLKAYPHAKN